MAGSVAGAYWTRQERNSRVLGLRLQLVLLCSNTAGRNLNTLVLVGSLHAKHCRLHVASQYYSPSSMHYRGCRKLLMSPRHVMLAGSPASSLLAPGQGIIMRSGSPDALNETKRSLSTPEIHESGYLQCEPQALASHAPSPLCRRPASPNIGA